MGLFQRLFKRATPQTTNALTENSPVANAPQDTLFPLWKHQLAMLQRCLDIEEVNNGVVVYPSNAVRYIVKPKPHKYCIGIMNDPPGCGKTHVMLSLIALDKKPTVNLVIVPENLHHQWIDAIHKFFVHGTFPYVSIKTYNDLLTYGNTTSNSKIQNYRLVIITGMLAERFIVPKGDLCRVIVDEVDTVSSIVHNIPNCKRVWFMSASFDASQAHQGLLTLGPFNLSVLSTDEILQVVCKCDTDFMLQNQEAREEPHTELIEVKDTNIDELFEGVLSPYDIQHLHAYTVPSHLRHIRFNGNYLDFAQQLYTEYQTIAQKHEECEILQKRIDDIKQLNQTTETKLTVFKALCERIKENANSKWLLFSDHENMLDYLTPILESQNIWFAKFDGGTLDKNEEVLRNFKNNPQCKVLLLNSMRDGVGLNLENTTHILFSHYTNPYMVEQVLGRALRPGRIERLNIVCMYHTSEIPSSSPAITE